MAKRIIKATISRNKTSQSTHYIYPSVWMANKESIQVICYETFSNDGVSDVQGRGGNDEFVYAYVDESLIPVLTADPDIVEITRAVAESEIPRYLKQVDFIRNEPAVLSAASKVGRGQTLTVREQNILNPDNVEPGINRSKSIVDILNDAGIT